MKKYLVAYNCGAKVKSSVIEVDNKYKPSSDNCNLIKRKIIKNTHPKYERYYSQNGYVDTTSDGYIELKDLILLSISNLEQ